MTVRELMKILDGMKPDADVFVKNVTGDPFKIGLKSVLVSHNGSLVTLING